MLFVANKKWLFKEIKCHFHLMGLHCNFSIHTIEFHWKHGKRNVILCPETRYIVFTYHHKILTRSFPDPCDHGI